MSNNPLHGVMIWRRLLVATIFFLTPGPGAVALDTDAMTEQQGQELIETVDPAEIRKRADSGDAMMQYSIGWMLMKGINVEKDVARGNTKAMVNLAYMYQDGKGLAVNDSRALALFSDAATAGDPRAQMSMAMRFFNGKGVTRDASDRMRWLRASAVQGYADAQTVLGTVLVQGVFSDPSYEEGAVWLKKAANQGHPLAQSNLGDLYFGGHGVRKDHKRALYWYRQAAAKGVPQAMDAIRRMQENGLVQD